MSRFGFDPLAFFKSVYNTTPPWDIGTVQPAMAALLANYPPTSPVLDVGCGSGDLSIYIARLGYQVTGIDFVEAAITQAQEKKHALPPEVADLLTFQAGDALKPSALGGRFGAVVDSGFFHLFDSEQGGNSLTSWQRRCTLTAGTICTSLPLSFRSPACRAASRERSSRHVLQQSEAGAS